MSDAILNVRFGEWHVQILRARPFLRISHNPYHALARKQEANWRWFEIY
ncbi:hypothetical protein [Brucella abortus]|nr:MULTISPECIES: hypothetical protein [Brucella]